MKLIWMAVLLGMALTGCAAVGKANVDATGWLDPVDKVIRLDSLVEAGGCPNVSITRYAEDCIRVTLTNDGEPAWFAVFEGTAPMPTMYAPRDVGFLDRLACEQAKEVHVYGGAAFKKGWLLKRTSPLGECRQMFFQREKT